MGQNGGFWPLSEKVFWQSNSNLMCTLIGWLSRNDFTFWPRWPNFVPLVATKWLKMVVSDHYLNKYSRKPNQTWCVHLLGDCSELICFLAALAKFWPSSGHKMTENDGSKMTEYDGFRHYLEKFSCNPVQTWCVHFLGNCSEFIRWPNFGPLVATKWLKWWFRILSGKVFT